MNKVNIIKSESFCSSLISEQCDMLNNAINDHISESDHIINIQLVEWNGYYQFWIYTN